MALTKTSTTYSVLRAHGLDRREFLSFCTKTAAARGLGATAVPDIVKALSTQPRIPVIWLHGLECTCCSESILRSSTPIIQDVIMNMISLDYDDTLQVAAGFQAEQIRELIMHDHPGQYLLAVEGNAPTNGGGVYCTVGGRTFLDLLQETAQKAKAVIAWGSCATSGCVQAASPNPTGAKPVSAVITGAPVVNLPGCPPIAEVMTGVIVYLTTYGTLPALDAQGRPRSYYGRTVHDDCPRRENLQEGRFVERWDDSGARSGYCLFKMGCRGPVTHANCSRTKFNGGTSWPVGSGHPCIGCSESRFWDNGPLYQMLDPAVVLPHDHPNIGTTLDCRRCHDD